MDTRALGLAARLLQRIADVAVEFDAVTARWRGPLLVGGAIAVNAALLLSPTTYAWLLPVYALICWAFVVARIWSLRDESGHWTPGGVARGALGAARGLADAVGGLFEGAWTEGLRRVGVWLLGAGIVIATVAQPGELVVAATGLSGSRGIADALAALTRWAFIAAATGLLAWAIGWFVQRRSVAAFAQRGPISVLALPAFVDLRRDGVPSSTPPALRDLFQALGSWRPRVKRGSAERDFEADLVRHLRRSFPRAEVDRQRSVLGGDGKVFRPDVTFQRAVALELKVTNRVGEVDRAVGQVERYAERWREGPVLVLHCETDEAFLVRFADRFAAMRARGLNVAVLAAGRRS